MGNKSMTEYHKPPKQAKVAILTAGGLAPCLSSSVGFLIEKYTARNPSIEIICYISGYKGLLSGEHVKVTDAVRENASVLQLHGGSPIGNSRVKLTNVEDCVKRGLTVEGENPLHRAADQVTILHTIGGDDTNTQAAKIAEYLEGHNYPVTVVGMPRRSTTTSCPSSSRWGRGPR